jgi:hypothetical protein
MLREFGAPVICFVDESATDAKDSDVGIMGAMVT